MNTRRGLILVCGCLAVLAAGCSREPAPTGPTTDYAQSADKNGTETLGAPDIGIAAGSGFAQGAVGLFGTASAVLEIEVPLGATIQQVLLYWAGGTTGLNGDPTINLDENTVTGELIGGPTLFFSEAGLDYRYRAYRADITGLGLVEPGANSLVVSGLDFDTASGSHDGNNGASLVVIYDDGTAADVSLVDGIDTAYYEFQPPADRTVPQTFHVTPAASARTAELLLATAVVGGGPNRVVITTGPSQTQTILPGELEDHGSGWVTRNLPVTVPAGDDEVTVELLSVEDNGVKGICLAWVAAGLAIATPEPATIEISGAVFVDNDESGQRDSLEAGIAGVVVDLTDAQGVVTTAITDADGQYRFSGPAGTYTVAVDPAAHPEAFNADLAASFSPTTVLVTSVVGAAAGIDFGFAPAVQQIVEDLATGELSSTGEDARYWRKVFRGAILAEFLGRYGRGHDRHRHRGHGWGHRELYPDADELRALLSEISALYLPEPYQFREGRELWDVLRILKSHPATDEENLFRELLVTELNFVSGRGLVGEQDRLGVLISWGESVLATPPDAGAAKADRLANIRDALIVFKAVNTGGGGGVDE